MLTLLGSGGWIPSGRRETCCAAVREGDRLLVIDAGTGLRRLVLDPAWTAGVAQVDVVLTHFHTDHTCGLTYLPALPVERIVVHGPGAALYGAPTATIAGRVFADPLQSVTLDDVVAEVRDLELGVQELGPWRLTTRAQRRHPHPTLGLRLGDDVAYVTDTGPDPETPAFAAGCRVLAHEAWGGPGEDVGPGHTTSDAAARLAAQAGVQRLVLLHVHPTRDERALQAGAPGATVGEDGLKL
jgi:ribonuclease BN (tRNA processing enzyme)